MPAPRVTIYDVAAAAGVSVATVSRAFSAPDRVSNVTRQHVLDVARELGYVRHALRAARSGRPSSIAVLISDVRNPHYFEVIRGIEKRASSAGLLTVLIDTEESGKAESRHVEALGHSVAGFVLVSSRLTDAAILDYAGELPVVLVSREVVGVPSVTIDPLRSGAMLMNHLASLGHRSVGYLAGPRRSWLRAKRWRGLSLAASELGIEATQLGTFAATFDSGADAADVALANRATAVVAHNDLLAMGVLSQFRERGVDVPGHISIASFDDMLGAAWSVPGLTTVAGSGEDVGRLAVELCLNAGRSDRREAEALSLPPRLIVRGSTGPVRRPTGRSTSTR